MKTEWITKWATTLFSNDELVLLNDVYDADDDDEIRIK